MAQKNWLGSPSASASSLSASLDKAMSRVFRPEEDASIITLRCPKNNTPNDKYCRFTLRIPGKESDNNINKNNNSVKIVGGNHGHSYNNNNNTEVIVSDSDNNNNNNIKVVKLDDLSTNVEDKIGNCIICYDKACRCVYFPCGHLNSCYECGVKVYLSQSKCPVCNTSVRKVIKVYFDCKLSDK